MTRLPRASRALPFLVTLLAGLFLFAIAEETASPGIDIAVPGYVPASATSLPGDALSPNPDEDIFVTAEIDGELIGEVQGGNPVEFNFPIPPGSAGKEILVRAHGSKGSYEQRRVRVLP